jgi:MATE family multidrug resistance protein
MIKKIDEDGLDLEVPFISIENSNINDIKDINDEQANLFQHSPSKQFLIPKKLFDSNDQISTYECMSSLIKSSFPSILVLFSLFLNDTINLIFAGRYFSSDEISAIGLGSFYVNSLGYIFGIGLLGGVDTICSQAFGAKQYFVVGVFINISKICLFAFSIFIIIPSIFLCRFFYSKIGQDGPAIELASQYVIFLIPFVIFSLQFHLKIRYLQAMDLFLPGMIVSISTTILHPFWCYLFIIIIPIGIKALSLSLSITSVLNYYLISFFINTYNPYPETQFEFSYEIFHFKRFYDFLTIAVPSAFMFSADWLGFEIIILLSSYLNNESLAANVILFTFISLVSSIPLGLGLATTSLVGNAIGGSKPQTAIKYSVMSCVFGFFLVLIIALVVGFTQEKFIYIYTEDEAISVIIYRVLEIYIIFSLIDAVQILLSSIVKALGKQHTVSVLILIVLYPINIPFSITLAYLVNYKLKGLWMAQLTSITLLACSYLILIFTINWENVILRTIIKVKIINEKLKLKADNLLSESEIKR